MSKLLSDLSNDFKTYRFTIGELVGEPSQTKTDSDTDLLHRRIELVKILHLAIKCNLDVYAMWGQEKRIKDSETKSRGMIRDLLVNGESSHLMKKGMTLERMMKDLKVEAKRLIGTKEEIHVPPSKPSELMSMSGI